MYSRQSYFFVSEDSFYRISIYFSTNDISVIEHMREKRKTHLKAACLVRHEKHRSCRGKNRGAQRTISRRRRRDITLSKASLNLCAKKQPRVTVSVNHGYLSAVFSVSSALLVLFDLQALNYYSFRSQIDSEAQLTAEAVFVRRSKERHFRSQIS